VFKSQSAIEEKSAIKNKIMPIATFKEIPREAKSEAPNIACLKELTI
jgi:hypothetical protein